MRWINLIGIVPLAMIMSALLARLSRPAEVLRRDRAARS
jgi:hypothetical protein